MRFAVEHRFATTLARFESLLDDPLLYDKLERELPGIDKIELLSSHETDGVVHRRVRYTPRADGKIPAFGRGLVTPEMLAWVEDSTFRRSLHRIDYRVEPNLPERWRDQFQSHGSFHLHEAAGEVIRRVEGEVIVRVALFGPIVERMLVNELKKGFSSDAQVLRGWLSAAC